MLIIEGTSLTVFFTAKVKGRNEFHPDKYFVLVPELCKNTYYRNFCRLLGFCISVSDSIMGLFHCRL